MNLYQCCSVVVHTRVAKGQEGVGRDAGAAHKRAARGGATITSPLRALQCPTTASLPEWIGPASKRESSSASDLCHAFISGWQPFFHCLFILIFFFFWLYLNKKYIFFLIIIRIQCIFFSLHLHRPRALRSAFFYLMLLLFFLNRIFV